MKYHSQVSNLICQDRINSKPRLGKHHRTVQQQQHKNTCIELRDKSSQYTELIFDSKSVKVNTSEIPISYESSHVIQQQFHVVEG